MKTKILIWMFVLVALSSFAFSASAEDNLELHYNFSSLTDLSGNGNDGTNNGATAVSEYPTYNISGDSNPDSFDFDGSNDYINFNINDYTDEMTFSWWAKSTNTPDDFYIFGAKDDSNNMFFIEWRADLTNGYIGLRVENGGTETKYQWINLEMLDDGNWHHYLITFSQTVGSGNAMDLYVDGVEKSIYSYSDADPSLTSLSQDMYIGAWNDEGTSDKWFDGTIDEVRIYNTSLTATQIGDLYNYGTTAPVTATSKINVSDNSYPQNNTQLNDTTINFNTTVNASINYNCSLYINDTFNQTKNFNSNLEYCYQESATVNNQSGTDNNCGLNYDGNYNSNENWEIGKPAENVYDGDYNTYGEGPNGAEATVWINYTKPDNAFNAVWQIKDEDNLTNITIPKDCYDYYSDTLRLRVDSECEGGICVDVAEWWCYNGGWKSLRRVGDGGGFVEDIYEEGIYWQTNKVDFEQELDSGNYTYYISCFNATDSTSQVANTTTKQFYVDAVNPAINRLSLDNLVINGKNLTGQFNLTDDFNLFSYNLTIDGNLIDNKTNLNVQEYLLNLSYNTSSLANGEHTLKVTTADGHTAYKIDKFDKVKNGLFNDKLEFEDKKKSYKIYAKDKSFFDSWKAEKKKDRYTFEYTPSNKKKPYYDFIVETDERLHIIENDNTPWGSWLIAGNKWIDFDMPYEDNKVKIKRLSPYKAEVRVSNIKNPERMVFNSIGELNIISEEYTFYTISLNVTFESPIPELTETEMTLRVDKPAGSTITNTEASLTYNNTDIALTNQEFSSYDLCTASYQTPSIAVDSKNINFSWQMNITDDSGNSTFYYNSSQNVFNIAIDNCSTYNNTALNFTIIYPNGTDATSADMAGHFKTYIDKFNDNVPFNLTWTGGNDYGVCINPAYAEYTAYAQIVYSASGFDEKTYYFNNVSLDNTTNFISLYLSDNLTTSDVTFNVIDQDDSPISDVFIKIQEYEVETDSAETIEIIKTDNSGEAVSNSIILYDQKYKFILEQNGEIIFNSDPTIINSLTKTFRINTEDDYFEEYTKVVNTVGEVYYTNSTKKYTFTFSESTGEATNGCLRVIKRTINGDTELDDSCISSNSGTLNYIITEDTNDNTYIGIGYIILNGQEYVIDSEEVNFGSRFKTFGAEGILMTFFIFLTLATIGISSLSPAIALFMAMVSLAVAVILGIFFMSWTAMIVIIILGGIALYKVTRN